ncbi:hypothetical protein ABPG73_014958 [Tetrahymena malaccensis]
MIQEYCRNYSIIPQENNKISSNNSFTLNGSDNISRNKRTLSLNAELYPSQTNQQYYGQYGYNPAQKQNQEAYNNIANNSSFQSQLHQTNNQQRDQQNQINNCSPAQENKIRTKSQLDNEIEKLRMKLKSVKRNSEDNSSQLVNNVYLKQNQFKENEIPKNQIQKIDVKVNSNNGSAQKTGKGSSSLPNAFYTGNTHLNTNNKKVFSEQISDRILVDLKKQTAQKVEDFIENCYSSKNSKIPQQMQSTHNQNQSKETRYLKLGDITQQLIQNQNSLDVSSSNGGGNQSSFINNSNVNANVRQSLNIHTSNMYAVNNSNNNFNGQTTKNSAVRHSQGSLPINNIFQGAAGLNYVTPQNNNNSSFSHSQFHNQQACEIKKCTSCLKRREKSAEKVDRKKLGENKKQFLNKYNISDTRKEYSSYKEQKVQQRRFSIHTNQIQEPFNFVLQGNQEVSLNSSSVKNQNWLQQQQQLLQKANQGSFVQHQQQDSESYLDKSWNMKVNSHVKALQQTLAENSNGVVSNNNSKFIMLNDLNYSQIEHPSNKGNNNADTTSNCKSLNTTNIVDNSVILCNNQNNLSNIQSQSNSFLSNNNTNFRYSKNLQQGQNASNCENISNNSYQTKLYLEEEPKNLQNSALILNNMPSLSGTSKFAGIDIKQFQENFQIKDNFEASGKEIQFQKETFSRVVEHYESLIREKEKENEEKIQKYEQMIEDMHIENEKLDEYKQQLIIMNNDLAKELENQQQKNKSLQDEDVVTKNKFQDQELRLNQEILAYQQKIQLLEKEKSYINKAFEYKNLECDALKEEVLKQKQELQQIQEKVDQQELIISEQKFQKQQEIELINTRQQELHKAYKNQFNSFFEKIQKIKVINDDYLMANKKEFESVEKRFYEDSLITKPSCIQSTQGDDLETKNIKLEQENRQLIDKLNSKDEEISLYKDELTKSDQMNQKIIEIEQKKLKDMYEIEIKNLNQTVSLMKSNEAKLIEIINELEQNITQKEQEINNLKEGVLQIEQTKQEMETAAQQLKAKIDIVEEQENILEKKLIELSLSHQSSIEGNQSSHLQSSRGLEIQNLLQKVHKLQQQNKTLNEELIEREKQVNILQHQNQQCQKELEELRSGLQEFEAEVQEMKRIYNESFEQEKQSIIQFYEQKLEQQQNQITFLKEKEHSDANIQSGQYCKTDEGESNKDDKKQLSNTLSDPNILALKKNVMQSGLPPTNSKKSLISFQNLNMIKQDSNLALNRKHNETFEETFEDGRGGSNLKLSNIIVNQGEQNIQKCNQEQKVENQCTFLEYINKFTNEKGEMNSDAFSKEIFQLKEKELLQEIDNLNKKYYLQEQNTQLEISWIRKQTESTNYLDHTQYKEQLDSLQNQINQLKMIKQQLSAVSKEIDQRFEKNLLEEYAQELKQKQIEIQINEKEITQKLEQYASINEEFQLEFSKNINNLSETSEEAVNIQQKMNKTPSKAQSNSIYKKLNEIGSCQKENPSNYLFENQKEAYESLQHTV